jgi:hypothetical protein
VLERTQVKALPLLNRGVEVAPAVQACCGVCRSCMTTNVFTLAAAGIAVVAVHARRLLRRA